MASKLFVVMGLKKTFQEKWAFENSQQLVLGWKILAIGFWLSVFFFFFLYQWEPCFFCVCLGTTLIPRGLKLN